MLNVMKRPLGLFLASVLLLPNVALGATDNQVHQNQMLRARQADEVLAVGRSLRQAVFPVQSVALDPGLEDLALLDELDDMTAEMMQDLARQLLERWRGTYTPSGQGPDSESLEEGAFASVAFREVGERSEQQDRYASRPIQMANETHGFVTSLADGVADVRNNDLSLDGDFAAYVATEGLLELFFAYFDGRVDVAYQTATREQVRAAMRYAITMAHQVLLEARVATTLGLVVVYRGEAYVYNAGDTRVYHQSGASVELLTEEHNQAWGYLLRDLTPQLGRAPTNTEIADAADKRVARSSVEAHKQIAIAKQRGRLLVDDAEKAFAQAVEATKDVALREAYEALQALERQSEPDRAALEAARQDYAKAINATKDEAYVRAVGRVQVAQRRAAQMQSEAHALGFNILKKSMGSQNWRVATDSEIHVVTLQPGDRLLLFTDGMLRAPMLNALAIVAQSDIALESMAAWLMHLAQVGSDNRALAIVQYAQPEVVLPAVPDPLGFVASESLSPKVRQRIRQIIAPKTSPETRRSALSLDGLEPAEARQFVRALCFCYWTPAGASVLEGLAAEAKHEKREVAGPAQAIFSRWLEASKEHPATLAALNSLFVQIGYGVIAHPDYIGAAQLQRRAERFSLTTRAMGNYPTGRYTAAQFYRELEAHVRKGHVADLRGIESIAPDVAVYEDHLADFYQAMFGIMHSALYRHVWRHTVVERDVFGFITGKREELSVDAELWQALKKMHLGSIFRDYRWLVEHFDRLIQDPQASLADKALAANQLFSLDKQMRNFLWLMDFSNTERAVELDIANDIRRAESDVRRFITLGMQQVAGEQVVDWERRMLAQHFGPQYWTHDTKFDHLVADALTREEWQRFLAIRHRLDVLSETNLVDFQLDAENANAWTLQRREMLNRLALQLVWLHPEVPDDLTLFLVVLNASSAQWVTARPQTHFVAIAADGPGEEPLKTKQQDMALDQSVNFVAQMQRRDVMGLANRPAARLGRWGRAQEPSDAQLVSSVLWTTWKEWRNTEARQPMDQVLDGVLQRYPVTLSDQAQTWARAAVSQVLGWYTVPPTIEDRAQLAQDLRAVSRGFSMVRAAADVQQMGEQNRSSMVGHVNKMGLEEEGATAVVEPVAALTVEPDLLQASAGTPVAVELAQPTFLLEDAGLVFASSFGWLEQQGLLDRNHFAALVQTTAERDALLEQVADPALSALLRHRFIVVASQPGATDNARYQAALRAAHRRLGGWDAIVFVNKRQPSLLAQIEMYIEQHVPSAWEFMTQEQWQRLEELLTAA